MSVQHFSRVRSAHKESSEKNRDLGFTRKGTWCHETSLSFLFLRDTMDGGRHEAWQKYICSRQSRLVGGPGTGPLPLGGFC